jgi:hypothetical protein
VLHRASLCAHVLETLGFRARRGADGIAILERDGEVVVLPESGAVSNGIVDRLAEAAGVDSEAFLGLLAQQNA